MTNQTPKIAKGITQDMLVSVYKPIGTGENSEVFAGTIADLKKALGIEPSGTGITAVTSTDGSIDIDNTDPSAPDLSIESGEWTPDITSITSGATVDSSSAFYSKGGTVVNFTIGLSVQLGGGSASTSFKLSLPIASDFANSRQVIFSTNLPSNLTYCVGSSNSTDNLIDVDVFGTANGDAIDGLQITGQYLIV